MIVLVAVITPLRQLIRVIQKRRGAVLGVLNSRIMVIAQLKFSRVIGVGAIGAVFRTGDDGPETVVRRNVRGGGGGQRPILHGRRQGGF